MSDISIESLALMFVTVLLASLIGGFITVHFSSKSFKPHITPKILQTQNRTRTSTANLPGSRTPNRPLHHTTNTNPQLLQNAIPSQNHITSPHLQKHNSMSMPSLAQTSSNTTTNMNMPSNTTYGPSPPYTQNTSYYPPIHSQPHIFQYPPVSTSSMSNLVNQTINNGNRPPININFPIHSPTSIPPSNNPSQSLSPNLPITTNQINPINQIKITDLLTEQYQPFNLRPHIQHTQHTLTTPNNFGSKHKKAFDRLDAEILKFPPRSSMRVTEKFNTSQSELKVNYKPHNNEDSEYITRSRSPAPSSPPMSNHIQSQDVNGISTPNLKVNSGETIKFFNLPLLNVQGDDMETQKPSFPGDLSPSSMSQHSETSSTNSGKYSGGKGSIKQRQKIIIVCYKLPLKCTYNKETTEWEFEWEDIRNVLANLRVLQSSAPNEYEVNFVGWPGVTPSTYEEQENLEDALYSLKYPCYPLFLTQSQIKNCYKIFCRSILWPLFHYLMPTNDYHFGNNYERYWQSYVGLNNLYAKKACVAATDNDHHHSDYQPEDDDNYIIWFHDYHLLLAPHFVRRQIPLAQIGLFVHTTFPTSEVFRCLPTRKEILRGILSSDLVGFHTYDYARHFLSACKRILDLDFHTLPDDGTLAVHYLGRDVSLRIGHASILSHDIHKTAQSQKVKTIKETFWKKKLHINKKKVILGWGELDEVRGTILTIQSFYQFLISHPEWQDDIIFILCISSSQLDLSSSSQLLSFNRRNSSSSSRNSTKFSHNLELERSRSYSKLRKTIEDEINKMKLQFNSDVIQLIDSNNLSYNELLALYTLCDVAVFGTFWDGFNTVPYEFTAAQPSYNIYNNIYNNIYATRAPYGAYSGDTDIDDERGVPPAVILSEFMGCMRSLCGVFRINPWKISEVASTLHTALCMTSKERRVAHHRRFSHVMKYTLIDWSLGFINDLKKAAKSERNKRVVPIGFGSNVRFIYIPNDLTNLKQMQKLLTSSFKSCKYKILLFDYGGTLTDVDEMQGIQEDDDKKSNKADSYKKNDKVDSYRDLLGIAKDLQTISPKILRNLQRISSSPNTIVAIVSGQTRDNLKKAFASCPGLLLCAEKGAFFRFPGQSNWVKNDKLPSNDNDTKIWQNIVQDVLNIYTERTNGSYIQKKSTALVWHYENADPYYGDMQATEVERYLRRIIEKHHNLLVQRYDHCRALEVLPKEIHKGSASLKIIDEMMKKIDYNGDDSTGNNIFIMAVGNDRSDEKMFEAVELVSKEINTEYGFTVRIGMVPTQARFYLTDQNQMVWLLNTLSSITLQTQNANENNQNLFFKPLKKLPLNSVPAISLPVNACSVQFEIPKPNGMLTRRSHSYGSGLSSIAAGGGGGGVGVDAFETLSIERSVDQIPIPPTAPDKPIGLTQFNMRSGGSVHDNGNINNSGNLNFDLVSPEYTGSFFDNVAVRSHSYTSLSKLAKLSELNEHMGNDGGSVDEKENRKNNHKVHKKRTF